MNFLSCGPRISNWIIYQMTLYDGILILKKFKLRCSFGETESQNGQINNISNR